jgi:hypothetical protein
MMGLWDPASRHLYVKRDWHESDDGGAMTTPILVHNAIALSDDECTGAGRCHGCLRWCRLCGDVAHVCDARLRGASCDAHPVPPPADVIRAQIADAARRRDEARQAVQQAGVEWVQLTELLLAREAYDRQVREQEERELAEVLCKAER